MASIWINISCLVLRRLHSTFSSFLPVISFTFLRFNIQLTIHTNFHQFSHWTIWIFTDAIWINSWKNRKKTTRVFVIRYKKDSRWRDVMQKIQMSCAHVWRIFPALQENCRKIQIQNMNWWFGKWNGYFRRISRFFIRKGKMRGTQFLL